AGALVLEGDDLARDEDRAAAEVAVSVRVHLGLLEERSARRAQRPQLADVAEDPVVGPVERVDGLVVRADELAHLVLGQRALEPQREDPGTARAVYVPASHPRDMPSERLKGNRVT